MLFCLSLVIPFDLNEVQPSFMQTFHPSTLRWPLFHAYFQVQTAGLPATFTVFNAALL